MRYMRTTNSRKHTMKTGDTVVTWINHFITLVCFLATTTGGASELPRFVNTPLSVTVKKGGEAVLRCGIDNLGTKTVGWRKLPYNVPITIGKTQFLEYNRFKLVRVLHLGEWNLHIKNAQTFDSGTYECQVSSKDKPLKRNITLSVIDDPSIYSRPSIRVTGTEFVEKGDPIQLLCNVTEQHDPPQSLDWFKDGIRLESSYDHHVDVQIQVSLSDKSLLSRLDIVKSRMTDTGIYVCRASQKLAARIKVDVLNAEKFNEKRETNQGGALVYSSNDAACVICSPAVLLTLITAAYSAWLSGTVQLVSCSRLSHYSGNVS